ncbi:hypothetical protein LR48_Vigan10g168900 [Vigna angularis]|uniref:Uncharacterized protein n=1 Tax=Phaseolus angularis TaxID=3914 RepID=A0A0L9VLL8_PHAAN|nr:hypothetical protein LR48_Vigan10g168900 [Vigna angularis]
MVQGAQTRSGSWQLRVEGMVSEPSLSQYGVVRGRTRAKAGFKVNLVKEVKKERDRIRKGIEECKKKKSKSPLSGILPLSGTQEVAGGPLRGKMAAEGRKRDAQSPLSGLGIFGRNKAITLSSTPLKEDLGCSGYLFSFLGFILSYFHCNSSRFFVLEVVQHLRGSILGEEGFVESLKSLLKGTSDITIPFLCCLISPYMSYV